MTRFRRRVEPMRESYMARRFALVSLQFTLRPVRLMQTSAPSRVSVHGPGFSASQ